MRIRDIFHLRASSLLLGAYSALGLFIILYLGGTYNEFYARILGDEEGAPILKAVTSGFLGEILAFFAILLTTNASAKWKTKKPSTPGVVAGLLNASLLFGISAYIFHMTPGFFEAIPLAAAFIISGVVGVSTFIALYDWRLSDLHDPALKIEDLKFAHADALACVQHMVWSSMVFLTGGIVLALVGFASKYQQGTPQAAASMGSVLLDIIAVVFVGIGVWLGWIAPHFGRLEEIRLELRRLEKRV